jgi:hypothetical protein
VRKSKFWFAIDTQSSGSENESKNADSGTLMSVMSSTMQQVTIRKFVTEDEAWRFLFCSQGRVLHEETEIVAKCNKVALWSPLKEDDVVRP